MKKIYLSGKYKNKYALVDDEDFILLSKHKWYYISGYAVRYKKIQGKTVCFSMHREILGLTKKDKQQIDHINRNRLDNYKRNLRICNQKDNLHNSSPKKNTSSRYKGITPRDTHWIAKIKINNVMQYLGMYFYEKDAALAYDQAARKYYGQFAYLNFPEITDYSIIGRRNPNLTSKYKGIHFSKAEQKWVAQCYINGKKKRIGGYLSEEDAHQARINFLSNNK